MTIVTHCRIASRLVRVFHWIQAKRGLLSQHFARANGTALCGKLCVSVMTVDVVVLAAAAATAEVVMVVVVMLVLRQL